MRRVLPALLSLCLLAGCGTAPASEADASVPEAAPVSPVRTDWSKLTPYEAPEPLYSYFEPYSGDGPLQPREDYGPLLPYIGADADYDYRLYGLVTCDGRLVTEPVYCNVRTVYDSADTPRFLLLRRAEGDPDWFSEAGRTRIWAENCLSVTAASPDGSWVVSGDYRAAEQVDGHRLALYQEDSSITILDESGAVSAFFPGDTLLQRLGCGFCFWDDADDARSPYVVWQDGGGALYDGMSDTPMGWLDIASGTISEDAPPEFSLDEREDASPEPLKMVGYRHLYPHTDLITGENFLLGWRETDGPRQYDLLDSQGQLLYASWHSADCIIADGLISTLEHNAYAYVSLETGEAVFRYPIRTNSD